MKIINTYFADDVKAIGIKDNHFQLRLALWPSSKISVGFGKMLKFSGYYGSFQIWRVRVMWNIYFNNKKFNSKTKREFQ